jgi:hypothetical protein
VQARTTSRTTLQASVSAGLLSAFVLALLGAAVATAGPAAAIDDPSRPDARVTHGPSCRPGGLVVEVHAGTAPYFVRLATTRQPAGEDEATLDPDATVVLRTADVAWGETIDGRLEYTARDGSGVTFVDELEEYSFTRPTREDCAAVAAPTTPHPAPPSSSVPSSSAPATPETDDSDRQPSPPTETAGQPVPPAGPQQPGPTGPATAERTGNASAESVVPGGTVTLRGAGFLPGERVTVQLHDSGVVLGRATAGPDGSVHVEVRIPGGTEAGPATVDLVGRDSAAIADVELQVAGQRTPVGGSGLDSLVPLVAAAAALVLTVAGLVSIAGQQWVAGHGHRPIRSA